MSYPEMDKVMQICQLFNLNINELIHENLSEVTEKKKERDNISKIVDSFFNYITKVVNLFSSLRFRDIIKCLFEQVVIFMILFIITGIGGGFFYSIITSIFGYSYYRIYNILASIYVIFAVILGLAIMLHIFKIRYLDYYEIIIKDDEVEENKVVEEVPKTIIEKKPVKVIMRDPKHSEYSFIRCLVNAFLIFIKFLVFCLLGFTSFVLVSLLSLMIMSFLIIKSGLLFIAIELGLLGCVLILYLFIEIFFDFIFNRTSKKKVIFIIFIASLILISSGIGLGTISLLQYEVLDNTEYVNTTYEYDMKDDLVFMNHRFYDKGVNIEYISSDISNVKVVIEHSKFTNVYLANGAIDNTKYVYNYDTYDNYSSLFKQVIKDINDKKIVSYDNNYRVKIYANEDNIKKLIDNYKQHDINIINDLNVKIIEQSNENSKLNRRISELENYLNSEGYAVSYDEYGNLLINNE